MLSYALRLLRGLLLTALLGGCGFLQLRRDVTEVRHQAVIAGRVADPAALGAGPLRVFALAEGARVPAHALRLREAGDFELFVPAGRYRVFAFADADEDGLAGAGEAVAGSAVLEVAAGDWSDGPTLTLRAAPLAGWPATAALASGIDALAGARADLAAPQFADDYALVPGYWASLRFLRETGANVYLLEAYDPARIPVLFVHGARGGPRDWQTAYAALDRKRFQAWFYQYPTGMPTALASRLLGRRLASLHARLGFARLHVVAHSVGGLLVREMLIREGARHAYVERFVSVATPWGGERMAGWGLVASPVVVPAWADFAPRGEFLRALYARDMPAGVCHVLFYGERTGWPLFLPGSDGSVSLASLLDARALAGACHREAFAETHRSVLHSAAVMKRLNAVLADDDGGLQASMKRSR
ncbi:MAG: hypothetical protein REI09_07945 [Candidatus Dactylopiibacterium sp.]|nr:hypothetical protein [Candidatus Dactylopiibacterium sp.]